MDKNSPRSFKFRPKFRIGELVEVKCVYIDRDNLELVRNQISKYVVSIRISAELSQISVEQSLEYLLSSLLSSKSTNSSPQIRFNLSTIPGVTGQ